MEESKHSTRRNFLKASAALLAASSIPTGLKGLAIDSSDIGLTILHTNDWHSRIDPFPDNDPKYPGQGGAARRANRIAYIRSQVDNILLLDAGDVFQGTPYFNYYGGEPEFRLMSQMGYDAGTLGNHDFDNGIDGLVRMLPFASFPHVNCNYGFEGTNLEGKIKPHIILKKAGLSIGITGVGIDLEGLVPIENHKGIQYYNPVQRAEEQARYLKKDRGCDMVICLSHLGFEYQTNKASDRILAAGTEHIDLIIGGHTHTFMETPIQIANSVGKPVTINQVGWAGLRLGRIDYKFSSCNNVKNQGFARIEDFKKSIAI
jgi:5'-nucleotidase